MKKLISLILVLVCIMSLVGCGETDASGSKNNPTNSLPAEQGSAGNAENTDETLPVENEQLNNGLATNNLDAAITMAIMQHNQVDLPDRVVNVESHIILAEEKVSGTPVAGETNHVEQTTVYLVYLNARYSVVEDSIEEHSSTANSAAITFTVNKNGEYTLKEYWEARPGDLYSEDVNTKFPADAAKEALLGDGYSEKLISVCRAKATIIDDPNATVEKLKGKDTVIAQTNSDTLAYSDNQLNNATFLIPKGKAVIVLQNIIGENVAEITYAGHTVWVDTQTLFLG